MGERDGGGVALVSGANRGIGREVARQLGERGFEVLLSARDEQQARTAAQEVAQSTGAAVRPLELDVADAGSIERAAAQVSADPRTAGRAREQRRHRHGLGRERDRA